MSYNMKNSINNISKIPTYQSPISEYNIISKINTAKNNLHNIYIEIENINNKIEFIESRLNSKVPIIEKRKNELESRLKELRNNLIIFDDHKSIIEKDLNI